jgi:hypothetical protein
MRYLNNAFSMGMLETVIEQTLVLQITEVTIETAKEMAGKAISTVGHIDTATIFSQILGFPVPMNRVTTKLVAGDEMIVGQYIGPRLPEGASVLPEGAVIKWLLVSLMQA